MNTALSINVQDGRARVARAVVSDRVRANWA